ncbi:hypothetical protein PWT90_05031 [Aphanocladium album]|nr:hypothetical protein PWT90_05031 [Aphanocladium album]
MAPTNQDSVSQYPDGHYGALSAEQQEALDKFKSLVAERGYSDYEQATPAHEIKLLRFLRARRWDVEAAYTQFDDTEKWRSANEIDKLYETIDTEAFKELRTLYPQWVGRRDRTGAPVYVWRPQSLTGSIVAGSEKLASKPEFSKAKTDGKTTASLICFAALYENLLRFTQPLSTQLVDRKHAEVPITLSTYIMDVSGVSVLQFWSLKNHLHTLAFLASAYYPETLGTIFIVGAPPFFSTVFGWIKGWLDPVTVSKIRIVGRDDVLSSLEEIVEKCHIPKQYGGELEYNFGDAPALDPALKDTFTWAGEYSSLPLAPLIWEPVEGSPDKVACLRVGSDNGQTVRETVCTIPQGWRVAEQNGSCPPFSTRILSAEKETEATQQSDVLKLLPLVYRNESGDPCHFIDNVQAVIDLELDLSQPALLMRWLWMTSSPATPPPLHNHIMIDRQISLMERLDMHLVWTARRTFIKPMPRFLLEPAFWTEYLHDGFPSGNRPQATGFSRSVSIPNIAWDTAADIYFPPNFDESKKYPLVLSAHPIGSCKEQTSGNVYGKAMAEAGVVPRFVENPEFSVADFRVVVDYAETLPYVDSERIGVLGICGGGGYALNAAMTDYRLKCTIGITPVNFGLLAREGFAQFNPTGTLEAIAKQRTFEAQGAERSVLQYLPPTVDEAKKMTTNPDVSEATEYYKTDRGRAANGCTSGLLSYNSSALAWDAFNHAEMLMTKPFMVVVGGMPGSFGAYRDALEVHGRAASKEKEVVVLPGVSHYSLYDKPESVKPALEKVIPFLKKHLSKVA